MGILQKISNIALKPSVAVGNLITKGLEKVTGKEYGRTTSKELSNTTAGKILGTTIAATTIAAVPIVAGPTATSSAIKSVIPTSTKGKVIAAVGTLALAGAVGKEPEATLKAAVNLPSNIVNVGGNVAQLIAEPSLQSAKELITENPVIVGSGLAAVVGSSALAIGPAIASFKQTEAIKQQTEAIISSNVPATNIPQSSGVVSDVAGSSQVMNSSVIPAKTTTSDITATTGSGTRKKKRSKALPQQIRQSVRVNVVANSSANRTTKNYLNTIKLLN